MDIAHHLGRKRKPQDNFCGFLLLQFFIKANCPPSDHLPTFWLVYRIFDYTQILDTITRSQILFPTIYGKTRITK